MSVGQTQLIVSRKIGRISIDDRSGDFIEYSGPLEINLRTLFHFRKPLPPRIDPCSFKRPLPVQPTPLGASGIPGAWLWGGAPLAGYQLDAIGACFPQCNRVSSSFVSGWTKTTTRTSCGSRSQETTHHMGRTSGREEARGGITYSNRAETHCGRQSGPGYGSCQGQRGEGGCVSFDC
jgi:hypothetical protein